MSLIADVINDRKPIEFLLNSHWIGWGMKKFSCEKCSEELLVVVCSLSAFFCFCCLDHGDSFEWGRWGGRREGWRRTEMTVLTTWRTIDIRCFTWCWSPLSEKIEDSSTCFQLELHLLLTCEEHGMNGHHKCGGHIWEFYSQRGRHLTGASLSGGARTIKSWFLFIRDAPFTENWQAVLGFRLTSICECSSLIKSKHNTIFGPVWESVVLTKKLPDGR